MAEQALVCGDTHRRTVDLASHRLATQLPVQFADLGDGLCGDGFAEASEPARRVHRYPAADRGSAAAQQRLGLAPGAQSQMLVPVELQRGRQVVDLGEPDVV